MISSSTISSFYDLLYIRSFHLRTSRFTILCFTIFTLRSPVLFSSRYDHFFMLLSLHENPQMQATCCPIKTRLNIYIAMISSVHKSHHENKQNFMTFYYLLFFFCNALCCIVSTRVVLLVF